MEDTKFTSSVLFPISSVQGSELSACSFHSQSLGGSCPYLLFIPHMHTQKRHVPFAIIGKSPVSREVTFLVYTHTHTHTHTHADRLDLKSPELPIQVPLILSALGQMLSQFIALVQNFIERESHLYLK